MQRGQEGFRKGDQTDRGLLGRQTFPEFLQLPWRQVTTRSAHVERGWPPLWGPHSLGLWHPGVLWGWQMPPDGQGHRLLLLSTGGHCWQHLAVFIDLCSEV